MDFIQHFYDKEQKPRKQRMEDALEDNMREGTVIIQGIPAPSEAALSDFAMRLAKNTPMCFNVGISVVHPKDVFCRKTGLDLAKKALTSTEFRVVEIQHFQDDTFYIEFMENTKGGRFKKFFQVHYNLNEKRPVISLQNGMTPSSFYNLFLKPRRVK